MSSTAPAGPTNGRPVRSSASPGCSPTSTIEACSGPSPKTACVALAKSGHASQSCAAEASPRIERVGGTGSVGVERLGLATAGARDEPHVDHRHIIREQKSSATSQRSTVHGLPSTVYRQGLSSTVRLVPGWVGHSDSVSCRQVSAPHLCTAPVHRTRAPHPCTAPVHRTRAPMHVCTAPNPSTTVPDAPQHLL